MPLHDPSRIRILPSDFRWLLLLGALLLLLGSLGTAFMPPAWIDWQHRLMIAGLEGERGYRYALVPLVVAVATWPLRRSHPLVTRITIVCCLVAFALMLKPVVQAWWLGRGLPAQLTAAFGPAKPNRTPFSLAGLYAARPASAPSQEMSVNAEVRITYFPAIGRSPAPCVIVLHGGGWYGGSHRDQRPFNHWLAGQGYAVANLGYRLLPKHGWPAQRDDVVNTIAFLRAHASELGLDPHRFVLLGRSSGAQIALAAGYAAQDAGIRGVISIYGLTDLRTLWNHAAGDQELMNGWTKHELLSRFLGGPPVTSGANYDSASGVFLTNSTSPPTLIIHGSLDSLMPVEQSQRFAATLTAAKRPNTLVEIPWATHAYDTIDFNSPGAQLTTYSIEWFLETVTR